MKLKVKKCIILLINTKYRYKGDGNLGFFTPAENASNFINVGLKKTTEKPVKIFLLAIMAGAFIAITGSGVGVATHAISNASLSKLIGGLIFPCGLTMVILAGSELFTGNMLISVSCLEKKSKWSGMIKNLIIVYIGNFVGSILVVWILSIGKQWDLSSGLLGAMTIKTAVAKVSLPFLSVVMLGIMCNFLICIAVWIASAAKDVAGKVIGLFLPVAFMIFCGFEHCIANMYFIPAGIFALNNPEYVNKAIKLGVNVDKLSWGTFITNNLIPATIGNIIGGFCRGLVYWAVYLKKNKTIIEDKKSEKETA